MKKVSLKKIFFILVVLFVIPVFSGCSKEEPIPDNLKPRFETVSQNFKNTINADETVVWGSYSGYTKPTLVEHLSKIFNADPSLSEVKMPKYKNINGAPYDKYQLDDGFIPVSNDFFIIINNDGFDPTQIQLFIDTNGSQGPNKIGYDLFKYNLLEGDKLEAADETVRTESTPNYFETL